MEEKSQQKLDLDHETMWLNLILIARILFHTENAEFKSQLNMQ